MSYPREVAALGDLIGVVVADRYRLGEVIGSGGMGAVFAASDEKLDGQRVAVKLLLSEPDASSTSLARFRREAQILARINHPNVVSILDTGELDGGRPYIVMEYLEGESLGDRRRRERLPVAEVVEVVAQVARGLAAAHEHGVVHRDLKPHNLFLCKAPGEPGVGTVKILDFGISKMLGAVTVETDTSTLVGTPQYMAPEQARGEHDRVGARSDVFSLAVIAYELLSGSRPFDGEALHAVIFKIIEKVPPPLSELRPDLPARISAAIEVAMAKEPADRFADAAAFARALTGEAPIAVPVPAPRRPSKPETAVERPTPQRTAVDRKPDGEPAVAPPRPVDEAPTRDSRPSPEDFAGRGRASRPPATSGDNGARPAPSRWRTLAPVIAAVAAAAAVIALLAVSGGGDRTGAAADAAVSADAVPAASTAGHEAAARGRAALREGKTDKALAAFAEAYRAGDRRLATRVPLRQLLERGRRLLTSIDVDADLVDIALSGNELVVATRDWLRRYEMSGELIGELAGAGAGHVSFSPGGTYIAARRDKRLWIFDRVTGQRVVDREAYDYQWASDDEVITAWVEPGDPLNLMRYRREPIAGGPAVWTYVCKLGPPLSAINDSRSRVVLCSFGSAVLDARTGEVVRALPSVSEILSGRTGGPQAGSRLVAIDGAGRRVVVVGTQNRGYFVDLETRHKFAKLGRDASVEVRWVRFDARGERLVIELEGSALEIHEISDAGGLRLGRVVSGRRGPVTSSSLGRGGELAIGDDGGWIQVQSARSGETVFATRAHDAPVSSVALLENGRLSSTGGRQVRVWRVGDPIRERVAGLRTASRLRLSDDGRALLLTDGNVRRFYLLDGVRATAGPPIDGLYTMSKDGSTAIAGSGVYDAATGERQLRFAGAVGEVEISRTGDVVVVEGRGAQIYVREPGRGYRLARDVELEETGAIALSPDGVYVAINPGGPDSEMVISDVRTGEVVAREPTLEPIRFLDNQLLSTRDESRHVLVRWRTGERSTLPELAEVRVVGERLLVRRGADFVFVDPRTQETASQVANCDAAELDVSGLVAALSCRAQGKVVVWDGSSDLPILSIGRAELGDRPRSAALGPDGRYILVSTRSAVFRFDLSPEDRPPGEIDALIEAR